MAIRPRRVAVVGACGRMGTSVRAALAADASLAFAAALESPGHPRLGERLEGGIELGHDPKTALAGCDVAIDFAVPAATLAALRMAAEAGVAYVTGTTGLDEAERAEIAALARRIPVISAPNFSVSVNVLFWLAARAAQPLGPDFDAELLEFHHAGKRDARSGTALRLAEAIASARGQRLVDHLVIARSGEIGPRPAGAIAVQSLRGGDSPGEHSVYFAGQGERLELVHRAATRDHFARGAVRAAAWLIGRPPGLYPFEQVLGLGDVG